MMILPSDYKLYESNNPMASLVSSVRNKNDQTILLVLIVSARTNLRDRAFVPLSFAQL